MTAKMTTVKVPEYSEDQPPEDWNDEEVTVVRVPRGGPIIGSYAENEAGWFDTYLHTRFDGEVLFGRYPTELQAAQSIAFTTVIRSKADIDRDRADAADEALIAGQDAARAWRAPGQAGYLFAVAQHAAAEYRICDLLTEETERWCAFHPDEFDNDGEYSQYLEDIAVDHPERVL